MAGMRARVPMVSVFVTKGGAESIALSVFALVAVAMVNVFRIRTLLTVLARWVGLGLRVSFYPVLHLV